MDYFNKYKIKFFQCSGKTRFKLKIGYVVICITNYISFPKVERFKRSFKTMFFFYILSHPRKSNRSNMAAA